MHPDTKQRNFIIFQDLIGARYTVAKSHVIAIRQGSSNTVLLTGDLSISVTIATAKRLIEEMDWNDD